MESVDFSLIIPVFMEEESIPGLAREVETALDGFVEWECLWVDDGSPDGSAEVVRGLSARQPRHRLIRLRENSGQSAALLAGFSRAAGRWLGTLDGDGQNDPADLRALITRLRQGDLDLVNGRRAARQDTRVRRWSSRIANRWREAWTGGGVSDVGCAIRVFRRECVDGLPAFRGMHRFLPTLMALDGWRFGELDVAHRPRARGRSKYGIHNRLWVGLVDTCGVAWLQRRRARWHILETSG